MKPDLLFFLRYMEKALRYMEKILFEELSQTSGELLLQPAAGLQR